jgi:hypothetical protein
MQKNIINILSTLGKIMMILFSLFLIALVIMAVKLKKEEIKIPCENTDTISISNNNDYIDVKTRSTCELQYIEIKVKDEISKEKMKAIMLNVSFELNDFTNVEILVFNNNESLFGRIIDKGEIIITR